MYAYILAWNWKPLLLLRVVLATAIALLGVSLHLLKEDTLFISHTATEA